MSQQNQGDGTGKKAAKGVGALLKAAARIVSVVLGGLAKLFGRAGGRGRN